MRSFFPLLLILTFAFPFCSCTKPIGELLKECEALYNSEEFRQMQESLRDQFDNDPLEVLEGIKAAGGLDKFIYPIKSVGEGGSNNEQTQHKFVINKELLDKLKGKVYVPGKTYAEALKNHLNYYIFGKTNFEVLSKALNECNFEQVNVEIHGFQRSDIDGRVKALMKKFAVDRLNKKRQELLKAIQKQDSFV